MIKITEPWYSWMKWLVLIVIPALTTCYVVLAKIWDFPYPQQIAETSAAVCTMLGAILGISSANYYKELAEQKTEE